MAVFRESVPRDLRGKMMELNWTLVLLLLLLGVAGIGMLYSVAGGSWSPWALNHAIRLAIGLVAMVVVAMFPPRFWMGVSYPVYVVALILLVLVEVMGVSINGAQRWVDLGPVRLQPSEIMKLALVLALARYYHDLPAEKVTTLSGLIPPLLIIGAPAALIVGQPDLGTTLLLAATGAAVVFMAGLSWWFILVVTGVGMAGMIGIGLYGLENILAEYQMDRVRAFTNPDFDPLGINYHPNQAMITLGSGGMTGKGFLEGTQSQLGYLPEMQTDYIFTALGEEFGFVGGVSILAINALIMAQAVMIAISCKSPFLRILTFGIIATYASYVFINIGMVSRLLPVVGVPLPLISYGGTVVLAVLVGFGLILGAHIHRNAEPPRGAGLFG
ncbi:rod shape-determining protein RodA [Maricaulis sp.]|jgi:rod shape determining protein RodA|uniref:rod shape-determining protein RodA n=1 Tax=Maricaulis sp. TaxID=1486257 RepID=UPI002611517B|nr:rod shape-determining protein RodA [Maricaulis sp.]